MPPSGQLIVFEGADEVGKTTLVSALAETLRPKGADVLEMAFPGREPGTLGAHIYKLHHEPSRFDVGSLSPESLQLLHIASHLDAIRCRIIPALRAGKTVILDRFWWSTLVYGIEDGGDQRTLKRMITVEKACWGTIRPKIALLVTRERPLNAVPDQEKWMRHQAEYRRLAMKEGKRYPVVEIANDGELSLTTESIRETVANHIRSRRKPASALRHPATPRTALPDFLFSLAKPTPSPVYDTYWRFAAERQSIFFRKLEGFSLSALTHDPILAAHKFTNAYRASDRVSQFLIRHVAYEGDQSVNELFFRIILFKTFNRIDTWSLLRRELGEPGWSTYSFEAYDRVLTAAMAKGDRIYSAAYIMTSGRSAFGSEKKHRNHLLLLESMMRDDLPRKIAEAASMQEVFERLRGYPTLGPFLAYQYATDLNYSTLTEFDEMEFVVPGPGALDGIRKCFLNLGGLTEADVIRFVTERQHAEFDRLGIDFPSLWGRPLQLIDCQNLFCEVDKYARVKHPEFSGVSGRTRIKQKYRPLQTPIEYWYPPKWGLNERIQQGLPRVPNL